MENSLDFTFGSVKFKQTTRADGQDLFAECDYRWDGKAYTVHRESRIEPNGKFEVHDVKTPQGPYQIVKTTGSKVVSFGGASMIDIEPFLNVCEAPCLPFGVVPQSLKKVSGRQGEYRIGSVTFRIKPGTKGVFSAVDRIGLDGAASAGYVYDGFLENRGGGWLPRRAHYRVLNKKVDYERLFEFKDARLGEKPKLDSFLTNWNQPGFKIADRRVNPEVVWTSEELTKLNGGNPKITPDELLRLSKRRSSFFQSSIEQGKRQVANKENRQQTTIWIAVAVVLLMAATYVVPYLMKRMDKSKSQPK